MPDSLYRIDTFTVPGGAREAFLAASTRTIALLRTRPGFVRDRWFEKVSGAGRVDVVTMVEWADADSLRDAVEAVRALHAEHGFDAEAFAAVHGIVGSKAVYAARPVAGADA